MSKKTVLFFDRSELTFLYAKIGKYVSNRMNVIHVAFSELEAQRLQNEGITDYILYSKLFSERVSSDTLKMDIVNEMDEDIIKYSEGRFNLNSSIQSDRGYTLLSYHDALLSAQSHYQVWKEIFEQNKVDLLFHEPCSLFFNHIAAILCRKQGGMYTYQIQVHPENKGYAYLFAANDDFSCPEIEYWFNFYVSNPKEIEEQRARAFLDSFRNDNSVLFGNVKSATIPYFKLLIQSGRQKVYQYIRRNKYDPIKDNISYWVYKQNIAESKINNLREYKKKHVSFLNEIPQGERYYYYSFHLEPEAVVLYLGDGIYTNQIKLIENIASSLPAGSYLYVKDHPHEFAYRNAEDYLRLMNIPNIRLFNSKIPGRVLINNAVGVFTINGTAGFEALLMGKQVYCLGKNQYSFVPGVNCIKNIRDLRGVLYENINYNPDPYSPVILAYINAYLVSSHEGYVNYFDGTAKKFCADEEINAKQIADDIFNYSKFDFKSLKIK